MKTHLFSYWRTETTIAFGICYIEEWNQISTYLEENRTPNIDENQFFKVTRSYQHLVEFMNDT